MNDRAWKVQRLARADQVHRNVVSTVKGREVLC